MTELSEADSRQAALDAAVSVAEELDIPVTVRQLTAIINAAAPHLTPMPPVERGGVLPLPTSIDAEAPLRLVHSLIAAGWPPIALAPHMNISQSEFSRLIHRRTMTVYMARRVYRLWEKLHDVEPLAGGAHPRGITRARNTAILSGWVVLDPDVARQIINADVGSVGGGVAVRGSAPVETWLRPHAAVGSHQTADLRRSCLWWAYACNVEGLDRVRPSQHPDLPGGRDRGP